MISDEDYELLLPFRDNPFSVNLRDRRMKHLIEDGYLEPNFIKKIQETPWYWRDEIVDYRLSIKGLDALAAKEKVDNDRAEQRSRIAHDDEQAVIDAVKERNHDWKVAIISSLVTGIILLAIEHFREIIAFIRSFFQK